MQETAKKRSKITDATHQNERTTHPQASLHKGEPPILPNRNTHIIRTCPRYCVPIHTEMLDKVAAWFVDSDYDGRTFCITQAFFPDKNAWDKIARDLKGVIDTESFEMFSGTESLPFSAGEHACVAVKVIDPRGNEVMRVHNLGG